MAFCAWNHHIKSHQVDKVYFQPWCFRAYTILALSFTDGSIFFGEQFKLPETTILIKNKAIGDLIRSFPEVNTVTESLGANFPCLIVGGAIRDVLLDPTCKPKDFDMQVVGAKADILAMLKKTYREDELTLNPIAVVVCKTTETLEINLREAMQTYFDCNYVESNVNSLMFDLDTDNIIDIFGNGVSDCEDRQFRVVASSMADWHEFPEPPRVYNGKLVRVLKMFAKGFTFADESQMKEFLRLFEDTFDNHCQHVIAGKFSTFAMVLGHTVRGDILNFKDGTVCRGDAPLYDACIKALAEINPAIAQRLVAHMADF